MSLNSEGYPKNPIRATQQFASLGERKFIPNLIGDYSRDFKLPGDSLRSLESELKAVREFVQWAPRYLQDQLSYIPFCEKTGKMTERTEQASAGEITFRTPKTPFERRTPAELAGNMEWVEFMETYIPPRDLLLKAVKEVILHIPVIPDARYDPDHNIKLFDWSMRTGRYGIALALIPDLTDSEARGLFGPEASLAEIKKQIPGQ